ncbi:GNAT family N-acetyltransferase [Streptomyces sp. NPDC088757]|uniref:GNAT family N-acetyltransferase n=1 Tax=Streptomyces sp. NPDC088757 TaxID=3365889 RepID=UPI00382AFC06
MSDAPGPHPSAPGPFLALGPRVGLRPFSHGDADEFTARARESRELHRPWLFPPCTPEAYAAYAGTLLGDPARAGFLVCERAEGGRIAGFVTINNIVRGAFRSGALGYGAFAHAAGRGLLTEALGLVLDHAFGPLELHRLEANIQPGNAASRALVRRAGFRLEGFSPAMLFIDGAWRDHERWAVTAPATAPEPAARTRDGLSACG